MKKRIEVTPYVAKNISRTRDDFIVATKRGSGKGGQNRNKRETAVKITDKITGLSVDICDERSQAQNKTRAFRILVDRLIDYYREQEVRDPIFSEEVRVYKEKEDLVVDHRTGRKYSYKEVLEGNLPELTL